MSTLQNMSLEVEQYKHSDTCEHLELKLNYTLLC